MAQIFHHSTNLISRLSIYGGVFIIAALGAALYGIELSPWYTDQHVAQQQPVPFSHKHHAGELGIDCRYCHTTVETSANAGFPATHVCMTCHSQLWTNAEMLAPVRQSLAENRSIDWHRVARVPDYVYFRHDIHIAKGIACVECHGRI